VTTKNDYTLGFMKLGEVTDHIDTFKVEFWLNVREDGGLRLTEFGSTFLTTFLDIQSYQVKIPTSVIMNPRNILILDKWMRCPYYFNKKKHLLVLYGEHQASEMMLYGDNLELFFETYS